MRRCACGLRSAAVALAVSLTLSAAGCGGGGGNEPPKSAPDEQMIRGLVTGVQGAANSAASMKAAFAEGAAPSEAERPRYLRHAYEIKPPIDISGDEATVNVDVRRIEGSGEGPIVGEVQWTAVRSGDQWQLKSAPLPAAAK